MVWGAFHANGKSELVFLEGNQCADDYVQTLKDHLLPVIRHQIRRGAIFQQDNASIHTASTTKAFFKSSKIRVMDWPAKSPDLNPIENVWGYLAGIVYASGKQYDTKEELKLAIQAAWSNLDPNYLRKLSQSMKKRCLDVYKTSGEHFGK
jgi:transposase